MLRIFGIIGLPQVRNCLCEFGMNQAETQHAKFWALSIKIGHQLECRSYRTFALKRDDMFRNEIGISSKDFSPDRYSYLDRSHLSHLPSRLDRKTRRDHKPSLALRRGIAHRRLGHWARRLCTSSGRPRACGSPGFNSASSCGSPLAVHRHADLYLLIMANASCSGASEILMNPA
jgi:hypothetical protein